MCWHAALKSDHSSMTLQVTYRYKQLNVDLSRRKQESVEVKRKFPDKVPVSKLARHSASGIPVAKKADACCRGISKSLTRSVG